MHVTRLGYIGDGNRYVYTVDAFLLQATEIHEEKNAALVH